MCGRVSEGCAGGYSLCGQAGQVSEETYYGTVGLCRVHSIWYRWVASIEQVAKGRTELYSLFLGWPFKDNR